MNRPLKSFRLLFVLPLLIFAFLAPPVAEAQTYRILSLPNAYTSLAAGLNTNNLAFDNATGGPVNTGFKLPKKLTDGFGFQASFSCPTVTLAAVSFVLQGSIDGTNYHSVPGSAVNAVVAASASSANNTNVVYFTNFPASAVQNFNYVRLAGITNGNAADLSTIRTAIGFWD